MGVSTLVYIFANEERECIIGYTKQLEVTLSIAHQTGLNARQLARKISRLVYLEEVPSVLLAIERVEALERMSQRHLESVIEKQNPKWWDFCEISIPVLAGELAVLEEDDTLRRIRQFVKERLDYGRMLDYKRPDNDLGTGGVTAKLPTGPQPTPKIGMDAKKLPLDDPIED